jgi:hypothetical protein
MVPLQFPCAQSPCVSLQFSVGVPVQHVPVKVTAPCFADPDTAVMSVM